MAFQQETCSTVVRVDLAFPVNQGMCGGNLKTGDLGNENHYSGK